MKCLLLQFSTLHLYNTETYLSIFKYASPFPPVKDFLFHVEVDKVIKNELLRYSNPTSAINDTPLILNVYKALDV